MFKAVARDAAGNCATSAAVTVTVAVPATKASQRQLKKSFTIARWRAAGLVLGVPARRLRRRQQDLPADVVSPQNSRGWWNTNDTAGMLAHAIKTYRVDPERIYVTGLSMGGGAAWTLSMASVAGSSPKRFWASQIAAVVPIAGAADPKNSNGAICNVMVANNLPVFAFHGTADPTAKLTLYPGVGHDAWTKTYDPATQVETGRNIYQWLLSHTR